jgi:hypothetical protein
VVVGNWGETAPPGGWAGPGNEGPPSSHQVYSMVALYIMPNGDVPTPLFRLPLYCFGTTLPC